MLILGVVGQIASGKGILVNYLTRHLGFTSFSLSSIVHEELKKREIKKFDRTILQNIGDKLRKKEGDDVLARRTMEAIQTIENRRSKAGVEDRWSKIDHQSSNFYPQPLSSTFHHPSSIIIDGIRNPAEIEFFKKNQNFVLIGVKAKRELRYQRLISRNKKWDPKNYEDFLKVDRRDLGIGQNKSGQQVGKCLAYCDYTLKNNKDLKDFQRKVEKLMGKLLIIKS